MKEKVLIIITLHLAMLCYAQEADKFAMFSLQKKEIKLSTGITMRYIEKGKPDGIPVILLHGFTDTGRSFQFVIDELVSANKQLRVIAPDLRGHGDTSMPEETRCAGKPESCFSMGLFVEDVISLMDKLQIQKVHIVGHSMGSVIATQLSTKHPSRVASITLMGTFADGSKNKALNDFIVKEIVDGQWRKMLSGRAGFNWPRDAYMLAPKSLGDSTRAFLKKYWVTEAATDPDYLKEIANETEQVRLGTWIGVSKALEEMNNVDAIARIKAPVVILWATQDMLILEEDQDIIRAAFSKVKGVRVLHKIYGKTSLKEGTEHQLPDLGHNFHWAVAREVAADLNEFITRGNVMRSRPYLDPKNPEKILVDSEGVSITAIAE